jgi:5-methylcytosine-specific restriction endonuclease McrA
MRSSWEESHRVCVELAAAERAHDDRIGVALLRAYRDRVHRHLGYGAFTEYADRIFGYSARMTRERLRVALALEGLPRTAEALRGGLLHWSAVREITRVATPETEVEWIDAATGKTVRAVEVMVAERHPGQRPSDPGDPKARPVDIHVRVRADVGAAFREALEVLRAQLGGDADDNALFAEAARRMLGEPSGAGDDGRAAHQVLVTVCPDCKVARQEAQGEAVVISDEARDRALCDAQMIDGETGRASQEVPPATRRLVLRRDHHACRVPGCRNRRWVDVHHIVRRSDGGAHAPEGLVTLCRAHHDAVHHGRLWISGTASELTVCHPDGTPYGGKPRIDATLVLGEAYATLSQIGWPEHRIREVLAGVATHVGRGTSVPELVYWCEEVLSGERAAPA